MYAFINAEHSFDFQTSSTIIIRKLYSEQNMALDFYCPNEMKLKSHT